MTRGVRLPGTLAVLAVSLVVLNPFGGPDLVRASGTDDPAAIVRLIEEGRYTAAWKAATSLARQRAGGDPLELAHALDLLVEAARADGRFIEATTLAAAEQALAIRERLQGPTHPDTAGSLAGLGALHLDRGQFHEARRRLDRAGELYETAVDPDPVSHARVLDDLGILTWTSRRDLAVARSLLERAVRLKEETLGTSHPEVARSLNRLAKLLRETANQGQAREMHDRALAIQLATLGPTHPDLAASHAGLAFALELEGRFREATAQHERALEVLRTSLRPDHPRVAAAMVRLADDRQAWGDFEDARVLLERALEVQQGALGPDHPTLGDTYRKLGDGLMLVARYAEARAHYERALTVAEAAYGSGHRQVALAINNLALHYKNIADYDEAIPRLQQAAEIWGKLGDPLEGAALYNLGNVYLQKGDHGSARSFYQRALALFEERLDPSHPFVASALEGLADTSWPAGGDPLRARSLYERSLGIREAKLGPDHRSIASTRLRLAPVLEALGDWDAARSQLERAVSILEQALGPEHPNTAGALLRLGALLWARGDEEAGALELVAQAHAIAARHARLIVGALPERQGLSYVTRRSTGFDLLTSMVGGEDEPANVARVWDELIRSRAFLLDELALRHRSIAGSDELSPLIEQLSEARRKLANLVFRGPAGVLATDYRRLLVAAREDHDVAERNLAEKSLAFRTQRERANIDLETVAAALPGGSSLVAYLRYDKRLARSPSTSDETVPSYLAFVLASPTSAPEVVTLGPAGEIDRAIVEWKRSAATAPRPLRIAARPETALLGEHVRRRIWDPVASHLAEARRVFVVPAGEIHLVNLAALPSVDGRFLLETGPVFHHLSAERDLASDDDSPRRAGLLALGGPDFDAARGGSPPSIPEQQGGTPYRGTLSSCSDVTTLRFGPLPGTAKEAREVAGIWTESFGGTGALVLSGAAAEEERFKAHAPAKDLIHVASHGFFLGSDCEDESRVDLVAASPLLLSGIALAGANNRVSAPSGGEDGILTAEEIASLDLSGVRWAVLSACDTGTGHVVSEEGVLGLRRAFQIAGVDTLIMSLWAVHDEPTREWMRELYAARLEHGLSTPDAMRRASLRVLERRRDAGRSTHPFYWGAFVAAGGWR
jgi:CHAT domain-containing protein/Tfp pilus assembly protein PilF